MPQTSSLGALQHDPDACVAIADFCTRVPLLAGAAERQKQLKESSARSTSGARPKATERGARLGSGKYPAAWMVAPKRGPKQA